MRLITWNVNGIRARFDEVTQLVQMHRPDVLCLQEIKATPAQVPEPLTGLPDYHSRWHGAPGGYSGVSVHVRRSLPTPTFSVPEFDFETRIVVAQVGGVSVASVYVPNGNKSYPDKLQFLKGLAGYAEAAAARGDRLALLGDLNVARTDADVWDGQRDTDTVGQRTEERSLLERLIRCGYADVIRDHNVGRDDVFTWWPPWRDQKAKNRGWRIDYALLSPTLDGETRSEILVDFGRSDHAPVVVDSSHEWDS